MINEAALRWKGRLGSLKALGLLGVIVGAIFLLFRVEDLATALNNPAEPQVARISQLVTGEIGTDRYVSLSGQAEYQTGYRYTENNQPVDDYYFLVDYQAGYMVLVKSPTIIPETLRPESITVNGLTHSAPTDLRDKIEADKSDYTKAGLATISTLYVGEDEQPASAAGLIVPMAIVGLLMLLGLGTFFFPNQVFGPKPIDTFALDPAKSKPGVKASGTFQRLASVRPTIKLGKGTRKFDNSVANIVTLDSGDLMIYIHYILTTRVYGAAVNKRESDWGIFLQPSRVTEIEPGKLYSWRDRWAARIRYQTEAGKEQTLLLSFNDAGSLSDFASLLRSRGYMVGSGEAALI
jgi:hypothetical protein